MTYNKAVEAGLGLSEYVPDWCVTQQQIKIWHDDHEYCDDDELIKSFAYQGHKK